MHTYVVWPLRPAQQRKCACALICHSILEMRTLVIVTQKGGSGKSSLASSLAVVAAAAGEKVLALDLDPQGTLTEWAKLRQGETPAVAHETARLGDLLAKARADYSLAIVDTPGADTPATHNAIGCADLCLVPLRPTRPDALGIRPTVDALIRGGKRFAFVLSQCPPVARSSRAAEMAAGLGTLGFLAEPPICSRADFQDAYAAGQGVTEYAPQGKAAGEMRQLWMWVSKSLKEKTT
jgi:chromosome partitioning protein